MARVARRKQRPPASSEGWLPVRPGCEGCFIELACLPEGWICYLRALEKSVKVEALRTTLKYNSTPGEDATKSLQLAI
jgi:hypothetical protein